MIKLDLTNYTPEPVKVLSHVLNENYIIEFALYADGEALDVSAVSGKEVYATITIDGVLITEHHNLLPHATKTNVVKLNIGTNAQYTIIPGRMKIEIGVEWTEDGIKKALYRPVPYVIKVKPSVVDSAKISPESEGTTADIVREVIAARGEYSDLDTRISNQITPDGSVSFMKLSESMRTSFNQHTSDIGDIKKILTAISPLSEDIVCVDVDGTFYINPAETPDGLLAVFIPKTETGIDVAVYAGHWRRAPGSGVELKRIYVHNSPENVAIYSGETEIEAPLDYVYFTEISHAYLTDLAARVAALEGQMSGVDAANAELESVLNGTYTGGENE